MPTNRLENFSDAVFAVAITILVLELNVPEGGNLWHQLKEEWPDFASFFVSFWVIGIIWVNHHAVIDHLGRADRPVLYLNLLLLLTVVFIPYSTDLMAVHLKSGNGHHVAAAVYSGAFFAMGISFGFLWTYITKHRELLGVELTDEQVRRTSVSFLIGNPIYAIAVVVSFWSAGAVLAIIALLAVYYAVAGMRSPLAKQAS